MVPSATPARSAISETRDWYEARKPGLGGEFIESVEWCLQRITQHPEMYAVAHMNVRRANLDRFPYFVLYRIQPNFIEVIAS